MLPAAIEINLTYPFIIHEEYYSGFNGCYASYLLLQNVNSLNMCYAFEF